MSFNNLDQLYRSVIMDHYKNPRNKGSLDENAVTIDMNNPTCGDRIHLTLKVTDGVVEDAKFDGEGCSISMSSASMMTQLIKGKKVEEFGYLPGLLWLLIGAVIGGAVHDAVVLFASMRHGGKSLSEVMKEELGPIAGFCTGLAMLFIITITMAGLSMVVLGALERNPWGTFAVGITIPIAMLVGIAYRKTGN